MRLSTDPGFDQAQAVATIAAAAQAGITVFDTAHSYGRDTQDFGANERLLARALRVAGADRRARIVTKGGMARVRDQWISDGRSRAIIADCEASLAALDGLEIDMYLVHAPDPRTPWRTTVRALARLVDEGMVRRVGLANVNRLQLEEALSITEISAVQVALSPYDERAFRGGLVEFCETHGITVMAHSPLGGPRRAAGLKRRQPMADVASSTGASAAEVALAWLLDLSPAVVPIPGARSPEHARSSVRAARMALGDSDRAKLREAPDGRGPGRTGRRGSPPGAEVVIVMGIPGAGKSRVAELLVAEGYLRLNRDERGGSLRQLASALDAELSGGARQVVLDNTYLTRASRSYVIEAANRHRASIRCTWIDTPLAQAQVNLVGRLLERFGALPSPEQLREVARREPGMLAPTSQMRALRELEPPSADEGLARVERVPFSRAQPAGPARAGVFVAVAALTRPGWHAAVEASLPATPHLVFDWRPGGTPDELRDAVANLSEAVSGTVEAALCAHQGGPPICWCRPPLPGLPLAFAQANGLDPARSILVGTSAAHRTLATTLGATLVIV
jgi:aryl-alcohol dehydrogenase-like predicted oxidoreductase/predicted kinase